MTKTFSLALLALAAFAVTAFAVAQAPAQTPRPKPWTNPRAVGMPPSMTKAEMDELRGEIERRDKQKLALTNEGRAAEKRGDLATAESLYREACTATGEDDPFAHDDLARIYDKQGRDREAFVHHGIALRGEEGSWSSLQDDPRRLARYGDLCLRYSGTQEAVAAYAKAIRFAKADESRNEPCPLPRAETTEAYRAAAHVAAATEHRAHGQTTDELRELDLAVGIDGDDWVARFYRAHAYALKRRATDATREAALAEHLAPAHGVTQVREMRRVQGIPDSSGRRLPSLPPKNVERWDGHTNGPGINPKPKG